MGTLIPRSWINIFNISNPPSPIWIYSQNEPLPQSTLSNSFNSSVFKNNNDIIIIKELVYNNYYFIFYMVNKYLFLFNEKNNITNSFLIDEDD